jgi:hypothetical protein
MRRKLLVSMKRKSTRASRSPFARRRGIVSIFQTVPTVLDQRLLKIRNPVAFEFALTLELHHRTFEQLLI